MPIRNAAPRPSRLLVVLVVRCLPRQILPRGFPSRHALGMRPSRLPAIEIRLAERDGRIAELAVMQRLARPQGQHRPGHGATAHATRPASLGVISYSMSDASR